ncbi:hypothetical protein LTR02_014938 [Friedmanniomyces endolithicus]|uniref:Uncharacterized protein n=1 Tax=Friedmanniomyces endolithicus TaxID=329885 RepID=A0A4U0V2P1_9PEZI|nr:hypothetical protein LTS09_008284 [Friedmanniomyces endolithicus]KAK0772843.1 hypothetical protein LTR59_015510 [Friedmanniomyces endolithicus]KAK0776709.1 hypothetical protein LTR38_015417 [Friedmanniomyces endolithicus]KAK0784489.1 hypothetical protein LTR75_013826 [Friedmanniomyces endolithicus]KAK0831837.1 hypothetical protein LTR03_015408 [Friedmanniomyces endolithicus]
MPPRKKAKTTNGSHKLALPQELRDLIYAFVFCSSRFSYGKRAVSRKKLRSVVPANRGKALSLLRTCRRVHVEVVNQWLAQVLFHFEDPEALLDKLGSVNGTVRRLIRNVRMSGLPLLVSRDNDHLSNSTARILKLLPCLNLDKLTVLGGIPAPLSYDTLDILIRDSDGWKELHFLSHDSENLGYACSPDIMDMGYDGYFRRPQPVTWQAALERRDGPASRSSVMVYRSTDSTPCSILDPNKRAVFTQHHGVGQSPRTYASVEDPTLMSASEHTKEILVIVKRGVGVDYAEKKQPTLLTNDVRENDAARTWEEVKVGSNEVCTIMFTSDMTDSWLFDEASEEAPILDSYKHVDEYTWPPWYFERLLETP